MKKNTFMFGLILIFLFFTYHSSIINVILPEAQSVSKTTANRPSIPILMYHKVSPDISSGGLGLRVTPRNFESQMKLLAKLGYKTISLDCLLDYLKNGRKLPNNNKVIVISFDDGYRDNYLWARPILKKYKYSAIFFLVSKQIGHTNAWDRGRGQPLNYLLNLKEIKIMQSEGFEFGSHSRNHKNLAELKVAEARTEISGSKQDLEKQLGIKIKYFCFPFGRYNKSVVNLVKASGYTAALSTAQGMVNRGDNLFTLKRIRITGYYTPNDIQRLIEGKGQFKLNKKT